MPTQPETTSLSTAQVAPWNTWLTTVFAQEPGVTVVDIAAVFNPRNDATVRNDAGSHPNQKGARLIGELEGAALAALFRSEPIIAPGSAFPGNLNGNWNMPGTSGSATAPACGTVATGFTLSNGSGANVTATKGTFARQRRALPDHLDLRHRLCRPCKRGSERRHPPANKRDLAGGNIDFRANLSRHRFSRSDLCERKRTDQPGDVSLQCAQSSLLNKVYASAAGPVARAMSGVVTTTPPQ